MLSHVLLYLVIFLSGVTLGARLMYTKPKLPKTVAEWKKRL